MPVPVPEHDRVTSHQVFKPLNDIQNACAALAPDSSCADAIRYVIQPVCQPAAFQAGFPSSQRSENTNSTWSATDPRTQDGAQFACPRSGVAQQSSGFRSGLTTADNAVISKQAHAEACRSPAGGLNLHPRDMGLQHFGEHRSCGSVWSSYESGEANAVDFISRMNAWSLDNGASHNAQMRVNDAFPFFEPFFELGPRPVAEPLCSALLHSATTPFADFVDRVVVKEETFSDENHGHTIHDSQPSVNDRQHEAVAIEPLSNPTYIRAYRTMAEPLSEWMADYVWKVCTAGFSLPHRFVGAGTPRRFEEKPCTMLAKSIHSVLCATLLQPSAIILALWYISRLPVLFEAQNSGVDLTSSELEFRRELYGDGSIYSSSTESSQLESRAPFRIALLGCMLANKWLDDHTFSNKTWQSISDVPIQSINRLELAALAVLGHDLSVAPKAWETWLAHLQQYQAATCCFPPPIRRPSMNDADTLVRNIVMDLIQLNNLSRPMSSSAITTQPVFSPLLVVDIERKIKSPRTISFDPFEIDLDEDGPLREEYIPKRRTSTSNSDVHKRIEGYDLMQTSPLLPPPSVWSPHSDPPLYRDTRRGTGYVPGMIPSAGNAPHGRSLSVAYPQASVWNVQTDLQHGRWSSSRRFDMRDMQAIRDTHSISFGFPGHVVGPRTSLTRVTSGSVGPSGQGVQHMQSYSQTHVSGYNDCCLPPLSYSHHSGNHMVFPCSEVDPGHFRPLWLKT